MIETKAFLISNHSRVLSQTKKHVALLTLDSWDHGCFFRPGTSHMTNWVGMACVSLVTWWLIALACTCQLIMVDDIQLNMELWLESFTPRNTPQSCKLETLFRFTFQAILYLLKHTYSENASIFSIPSDLLLIPQEGDQKCIAFDDSSTVVCSNS